MRKIIVILATLLALPAFADAAFGPFEATASPSSDTWFGPGATLTYKLTATTAGTVTVQLIPLYLSFSGDSWSTKTNPQTVSRVYKEEMLGGPYSWATANTYADPTPGFTGLTRGHTYCFRGQYKNVATTAQTNLSANSNGPNGSCCVQIP